ncbi:MAG TPA: hypothetical protein EYP04_12935 [Anaerolineae bacterium]|nr:hypothetical protein [Anaerolineae bacterium]
MLMKIPNRVLQSYPGRDGESGQALIIIVLALPVLLGMLALALDGGYAFAQRRRMQNAADAAALAGARQLALEMGDEAIGEAVRDIAVANGAELVTWSYSGDGQGITVTAECTFETFIAGAIGVSTMTARATAQGHIDYLGRTGALLPMIIREQEFIPGVTYDLWNNVQEFPGNFGWLDWNGVPVSNAELASNIANPSQSGLWSVGDWVPAGPGVKNSGPVRNALSLWVGRNITIPFYDRYRGMGAQGAYHISGFGEFVLTGYNFRGSNKRVSGYFIRWVEAGPGGGSDHGIRTVYLAE